MQRNAVGDTAAVKGSAYMIKLPDCELQVMRVIWDAGEPVSPPEIKERLEKLHQRTYGRSTSATWLKRLKEKGFVKSYVEHGVSYVSACVQEEEYRKEVVEEVSNFWFKGSVGRFFAAFTEQNGLTEEDAREIREILDEWDNR